MNRRPRQPRGFAMLLALAMLALVAMLMVFLAQHFAYERQRTSAAATDAQLSQLLFIQPVVAEIVIPLFNARNRHDAPRAAELQRDVP